MTKRTLVTTALFSFFALFVPFTPPFPVAEVAIVGPSVACAQDDHIDIDGCFSGCHDHGMWWLNREDCGYDCAAAWFEWCMDEFCGGM